VSPQTLDQKATILLYANVHALNTKNITSKKEEKGNAGKK